MALTAEARNRLIIALTSPAVGKEVADNIDGVGTPQSPTFNTVTLTGLLYESTGGGLTALSGGQAGALALTAEVNRITTCAAGNGVKLPAALAGLSIIVINKGANAVQVYGAGSDTVDGIAAATGVTQMVSSVCIFFCTTAGAWDTEGLGTGYSGNLQTLNYIDSLTAVGTTQGAALALTNAINRVTTSTATSAPFNGVSLPASSPGLQVEVINSSSNPIQAYGAGTDTINGIATATGISHGVGQIATYNCTTTGNWTVQFGQPQQAGIVALSANGAVAPHTPHTYVVTKGSICALTLAAPTAGTDDGIQITITSDTAFAHTLTATGLLDTGSANVNVATFAANKGAGLTLMAYNGRWKAMSQIGITFS